MCSKSKIHLAALTHAAPNSTMHSAPETRKLQPCRACVQASTCEQLRLTSIRLFKRSRLAFSTVECGVDFLRPQWPLASSSEVSWLCSRLWDAVSALLLARLLPLLVR